ncbi:MAG: hypothetical protein JSV78_08095 [Phycisphaerales bacterium]|nr:MAG: hypothetical protein JSV78_08095 [Phycisphaerales bacterium]
MSCVAGPAVSLTPRTWPFAAVRADHVILSGIIACALLLYAHTNLRYGSTNLNVDAYLYYVPAHSWYFDGDFDYENNMLAAPGFTAADVYLQRRGATGRVIHFWPCGWSMISAPFVALAAGMTAVHNAVFASSIPRDGFSVYYRWLVPLPHVGLGLAGLFCAYVFASRYFGRKTAALAVAAAWLGTNVAYFVSVEPTLSHASSMAFVAFMVLTVDNIRRSGWTRGHALCLGMSCGMMLAMRHQNVVWLTVPAMVLMARVVRDLVRHEPRALRNAGLGLLAAAVVAVCLLPQCISNLMIEGRLIGKASTHFPDWLSADFARELLAPPTGLLLLYPLVGIGFLGLLGSLRRGKASTLWLGLLVGSALLVCVNACWPFGIGQTRRYVCCAMMLVLGLAAAFAYADRTRTRVRVMYAIIALLCIRNVTMMVLVDRQIVAREVVNGGVVEIEARRIAGGPDAFSISEGLRRLIEPD